MCVKILCTLLLVTNVIFPVSRITYYQALVHHYLHENNKADILFHTAAVLTAVEVACLCLVHWLYAFKMWVVSKKLFLSKAL